MLFKIGKYQILKEIGKGGRGEVFLAHDTVTGKKVALKRIRTDRPASASDRKQFLQEAYYTQQLSHPSIIQIYSVGTYKNQPYYTMPFFEGTTLRDILKESAEHDCALGAVSSLCHLFLHVCQAVSYAHSKGFIHRDLKPGNIMVGKFGEVMILDWGLITSAKIKRKKQKKIAGTISYMAPELIYGDVPTYQSEVYSLGMMFYEMLTLRRPFHRVTVSEFHDNNQKEVLLPPSEVAPKREIPPILSLITMKCLAPSLQDRYQHVEHLLNDLQAYVEGRLQWIEIAQLIQPDAWKKIGRNKRISKLSFAPDLKITAKFRLNKGKIKFSLPSWPQPIWITSQITESASWHELRIESVEGQIFIYIDNCLYDAMIDFLPHEHAPIEVAATRSEVENISVSISGRAFREHPFLIADALLKRQLYFEALKEYRKLSEQYPKGHFYAGVCLLEMAKNSLKKSVFKKALLEFEKLSGTDEGVFACIGKALTHQACNDPERACRLYEEAFQRFGTKSMKLLLCSHLLEHTKEALPFFLLAVRFFAPNELPVHVEKAISDFKDRLPLLFFPSDQEIAVLSSELQRKMFAIRLAFWIGRGDVIVEIISELLQMSFIPFILIQYAMLALLELGEIKVVQRELDLLFQRHLDVQAIVGLKWIQLAAQVHTQGFSSFFEHFFKELPQDLSKENLQPLWHIFEVALSKKKTDIIHKAVAQLNKHNFSTEQCIFLDCYQIWAFLLEKDLKSCDKLFSHYSLKNYAHKPILLNFLYGCFLGGKKGKKFALKHFSAMPKEKLPDLWKKLLQLIKKRNHGQLLHKGEATPWEKRWLDHRLKLFKTCY